MIDILAFGAHPDDIEFGCGGILASMALQGKSVVMVDLTLGEKSSFGDVITRRREAELSAQLIGAKRVFLDFLDCEILDTYEGRLKMVRIIREYKPKLVLSSLWKGENNHPDHIACGLMARYACRYARFDNVLPELPPHKVEGILHYLTPNHDHLIDFLFDITDYVETWKAMMSCYQSQMQRYDYVDWNMRQAAKLGTLLNKPFAQGLAKGNPIEISDLMTISKGIRDF